MTKRPTGAIAGSNSNSRNVSWLPVGHDHLSDTPTGRLDTATSRRATAVLFLIVVVDLIGFGIIIPLLPFYAQHYQATPDVVTLVMATYSLTQFVAAPLWGRLSDRVGRRPVLILSLIGTVASYLWLAFANSLWMLFAARALGGIMAGSISAAFAYIADITTPEDRARGMGLIGAAFGLGFIAGPAIGGILAGPDPANADYQSPALVAAGLSTIALAIAFFTLQESLSPETRALLASRDRNERRALLRQAFRRPDVRTAIGLSFLATFVFAGMETTFAMWSERTFGWGPQQNGYVFALVGVLSVVIQGGLVGRLARRIGERALVIQGAVALAVGLAMLPFCRTVPLLLLDIVVLAYGFSVITPALNSLLSRSISHDQQGMLMGVGRSASILARVVGPAWAGFLFAQWGKDIPYFTGAVVMVFVLAWALTLSSPKRHDRQAGS